MSKPDWAERLQRTFSRKYEAGYAAGMADKDVEVTAAYRIGVYLERKNILNLLKHLAEDPSGITLQGAITFLEEENK